MATTDYRTISKRFTIEPPVAGASRRRNPEFHIVNGSFWAAPARVDLLAARSDR